jgi:adenosylcobinamide-GDP ribazoletransferase
MGSFFSNAVRSFVAAFAFLTRLPVGGGPLRDADLGRSVAFFPVVGLVLGLGLTGLASLLAGVLPTTLAAVILVALLAALTGGLHLDGVADVFDALGGGRGDRQRMLEIMRDSRIGAHGAAALCLLLVAKIVVVATAVERHDLLALLLFPMLARWAVTPTIVLHPYARQEGLGRAFHGEAGGPQVVMATVFVSIAVSLLGFRFLAPAGGALAAALIFSWWLRFRLGGLTGDVYGATIELAEVVALTIAEAST